MSIKPKISKSKFINNLLNIAWSFLISTTTMSLTIHDLRVLLRDKMKIIDDLQAKLNEFRSELNEKDHMLREQGASVKKKDETIANKDLLMKEKDVYIKKLENELVKLNMSYNSLINNNDNNINLNGDYGLNGLSNSSNINSSNNKTSDYMMESLKDFDSIAPLNNYYSKTKRIAISAEPSQMRYNKNKDSKNILKTFEKSEE